jgi:DNA-3-methyladenine glycosylase II
VVRDPGGKLPRGDRKGQSLTPEAATLAAADPVMAKLVDEYGEPRRPRLAGDVYGALLRAIVGQQLSVKAAEAIYGRLLARYGGRPPTPAEVLADDPDDLRTSVGLSHAKTNYLRSLAEHVQTGELEISALTNMNDEEAIAALTAVKGIGTWSAHMFLMFTLGRPDILPVGDLGIRKAAQRAYGFDGLPTAPELEELGQRWKPHRTLASLYLWASLHNAPI